MPSTKAPNAPNAEDLTELEEYVVPESFKLFKNFLVEGQKLACALGIAREAKSDTQAAFLGFFEGISRLSCVQVTCPPISQEDLKRKPWIPMCVVMVDKRIIGGAFIMDFGGLENLIQDPLEKDVSKQLKAYYTKLLSSPIDTVELQHRINERLVAAHQEKLAALLNPEDLEQAAQTVCQQLKGKTQLLQRFMLKTLTYYRLWPDDTRCPPDARSIAAEEMGRPIHQDLEVKLALPSALLNQSTPVSLKPMLRFPGGGGTTGHGQGLWPYPADFEQAEEREYAFVCNIELPLLPESDGTVIMECLQRSMVWLVDNLEAEFLLINRAWSIDWDSVSLFGGSFGGGMAMLAYLMGPPFRIREVVLRAPLLGDYFRQAGEYAGIFISQDRASKASLEVLTLLDTMPYKIPRSGSVPPNGMFGGPLFSMSRSFLKVWKAKTVEERLFNTTKCPDERTRFFIRHGSSDKHVDCEATMDAVRWMNSHWKKVYIDFEVQPGKPHVWDAYEPLSSEQRAFFGMSRK
ncbi:hypothetical protein T440DRAFT_548392 [Plenodomus tracheiphilus IPT5]|uniref:Alpha/beta-hydrolase n=1 Tax=Plenodomus tracheiphilus IPT5 TaxID=1408161 RepID=A0A6A7AMT0_9PLEO|nr:hypothetical protein T440DRAFT_548392 [Plenodomus tracheiphilus IPT5]